jgi:hypothetical protein
MCWQIALSRESARRAKLSLGNVMYSAKYFRDNTKGITDAFTARVYTKKAITPPMSWLSLEIPQPPTDLRVSYGFRVFQSSEFSNINGFRCSMTS